MTFSEIFPEASAMLATLGKLENTLAAGTQPDGKTVFSAPGNPPRPGLVWKEETHRWINPSTGQEHDEHGHPAPPRQPQWHSTNAAHQATLQTKARVGVKSSVMAHDSAKKAKMYNEAGDYETAVFHHENAAARHERAANLTKGEEQTAHKNAAESHRKAAKEIHPGDGK